MKQNKYDVIICDLGNVLINFDHRIAVKKILAATPKKEKEVYDLFFDSPLTELYEEGKITPDEFFYGVKEFLMLDMGHDKFLAIWNEIFFEVPVNIKMHDFLRSKKPMHKLVMLSNINATHFEFLSKKMSIFDAFDKLVLSYEAGFRKPEPEIYRRALESIGAAPSKALYIDDRSDLIEAAQEQGIRGIVFDGESGFEKVTAELGA
ncbi:HAD family hydrolase [Candidatus Omnitrophota bacterium]